MVCHRTRDGFIALSVVLLLVVLLVQMPHAATVFTSNVQLTDATGVNNQQYPHLAVDSNGASHVTWYGQHPDTGAASQIWYSDNTLGAWSAPTHLTNVAAGNSQIGSQIAVDSNGASHVTWYGPESPTAGPLQIWYADNTSGAWSTPFKLTGTIGSTSQESPQIAVDSNGASHITWYGPDPTPGAPSQIWYADNTSGAWSAPAMLTSASGSNDQFRPYIAVDSNRASHITWYGYDPTAGGAYQIWYAGNTSGAWSAPFALTSASGTNSQVSPRIAVDSNRASHITWQGYHPTTGAPYQIWYSDNTSGAWSIPLQLTTAAGSNPQSSPEIAVDSNRASHITWKGNDSLVGAPSQIWYADNASGAWSAPAKLTNATGSNSQNTPQIAVDSNRASHITWYGYDPTAGGTFQIWYADDTSGEWSTTSLTSATGSNQQVYPEIAVGSNGASHITWQGNHPTNGAPTQIWYSNTIVPTVTGINPATGHNNQSSLPVTITGSDFQSGATLSLTGPDTIGPVGTTGSGNTLNATLNFIGKATGSYTVTVTNPDLISGSKDNSFVLTLPAPTVTGVSPNTGIQGSTVMVTDVAGTYFYGTPTVKLTRTGQDAINATDVEVVTPAKITCRFPVPANAATGLWDLSVQNPDGQSAARANAFTVNSVASTWYLAEGTTAWGFSTYISIENPNGSTVKANVTYMPAGRSNQAEVISLPPGSQTTLTNDHLVGVMGGQTDFSTRVECDDPAKPISVDRTMTWTGAGASTPEAHSSVGVTAPATTWYLPEGSSDWGFESWLLIQNPGDTEAGCQVTYMIDGEAPVTAPHPVPAHSRASFNMADDCGAKDASIKVVSNVPVIPERAMYKNSRREGHESIGTTTPAADFYLAEGTTAWGFTTYVLIQNPNPDSAEITVTYMTPSGARPQSPFNMGANSRKTIRVNDVAGMGSTDFSATVHGSKSIIAERAMYWDNGTGEACHDSIGMSSPHTTFYLPDGEAGNNVETWTLVQNPNSSPVAVDVTYLTPSGTGNVTRHENIPARSRKTFNLAEHSGITGRAAIMVTSLTEGKKIMVERSMYWNNKGAGTDTVGGFSD
ncbi:MAG: hypothetical protein ACYC99_01980 [Candidatus Geothermincolia bacterium]